ncbi:MAG: hypothetical protein J6D03_06650 [Clostridia bacterium]|nr:hypothetical protein [Clostridia bacterium]
MKVKELIEALKLENPEAEVILSADEEGNYFSPLEGTLGFGRGYYLPEKTWCGTFLNEEYVKDKEQYEYFEYIENIDKCRKCIVLFPIN